MLFLNTSTAPAISPISSLRPRPGIAILTSPPASRVMAETIEASAFEIERPINSDNPHTRMTAMANAISIQVPPSRASPPHVASAVVYSCSTLCLDFDDDGLDFMKRLRHRCAIAGNFQRAGGPGQRNPPDTFPASWQCQPSQPAECRHLPTTLENSRSGLFQFVDIFRIATQHEILLVPPHHQHRSWSVSDRRSP